MIKKLETVGLIARFKPLHNGGAVMLETLCENAAHVKIGLGSCNKYNARNPFTAEESKGMVDAFLSPKYSNYSCIYVPDFGHIPEFRDGQRWKQEILNLFGGLDAFVTGNQYVAELLENDYKIIHPSELIPSEKWDKTRGTMVRVEMAKGGDYKRLVPDAVADYLEQYQLVERFRKEFGLETLMMLASEDYMAEGLENEKINVCKG
jgi:nicotinamide-nucleotide adenylyltransferase